MKRRDFLKTTGLAALSLTGCAPYVRPASSVTLNDVHSRLNGTSVAEVVRPGSLAELRDVVRDARRRRLPLSVAGGRHAMGGQQFAAGSIHVDTRGLDRVIAFDRERGHLTVEAGIQWPALVAHLLAAQPEAPGAWGIVQKQTGADRFTIGGTIAANAHGRVLARKPFVADLESFDLMDADGEIRTCDRARDAELFRLAAGGYGLFGIVTAATLRLAPRRKVERVVEIIRAEELMPGFERRIAEGALFGDFQFSTDDAGDDFLRRGVFSCYRPVADDTPIPADQKRQTDDGWRELLYLAHADKAKGFEVYSSYYRSTSGQIYWSDTHQMSTYLDDYHGPLDRRLGTPPGTEMITEIYVPRPRLADFLAAAREDFRRERVNLIYGTIRLIETDDESFLPWARQPYACVIFNLHAEHSPAGLGKAADDFRRLIDLAIARDGSYFLTYHRWAERSQVERCHPRFREFLALKKRHDPEERFQSEWWRHYRRMFQVG